MSISSHCQVSPSRSTWPVADPEAWWPSRCRTRGHPGRQPGRLPRLTRRCLHQAIDLLTVERPVLQECFGHGCQGRPVRDHDPGSPRTSASEELISPGVGSVLAPGRLGGLANVRSGSELLALERGPAQRLSGREQIERRHGARDVLEGYPCQCSRGGAGVSLAEGHRLSLPLRGLLAKRRPANAPRARHPVGVRRHVDARSTPDRLCRDLDVPHRAPSVRATTA